MREIVQECLLENEDLTQPEPVFNLNHRLISFFDQNEELKASPARDVCQYECELLELKTNPETERVAAAEITFSPDQLNSLVPVVRGHFKVVRFPSDVAAVAESVKQGSAIPNNARPVRILFHSEGVPMFVNEETETLLTALISNTKTTDELIESVSDSWKATSDSARSKFRAGCLALLEGLYWAGIVDFNSVGYSGRPAPVVQGAAS
jgi:hypothetical protein